MSDGHVSFESARLERVLGSLERLASGELEHEIEISPARDELDAIAHAVNVLAQELLFRLKQLQKAQSTIVQAGRLAALGEISSGLAHELNNPLTVIVGHLERVAEAVRGGPKADLGTLSDSVARMERNTTRMTLIIRHIMEFARQSKPSKRSVRLNEVIERAFILMGEQLRLKRIRVSVELATEDPQTLGDELRLEQVFINLLTNARDAIIEARGDGGGTIRVSSRVLSEVELEVAFVDDGVGMSADVREKIFEPFFTTKEVGQGTGLGLSISHGIVEDHGGQISCESEPGAGAIFRIRLPRQDGVAVT